MGTSPGRVDAGTRLKSLLSVDPKSEGSAVRGDAETVLEYKGIVGFSLFAGAIASAALPLEVYSKPPSCRWCGSPNAIDRWASRARWERPCRAGRLSYWSLGLASLVALGPMSHETRRREWLVNAGAILDSTAVTVMVTQLAKYTVRRARPASNPCHVADDTETDRNLSFFSGHTAIAFAVVASAHETERLRGRSSRNWLVAGGAAAALTGYLRIAADRHHLSDVLAGAAVGTAIGTWTPRRLHRPKAGGDGAAPALYQPPPAIAPPLIGITASLSGGSRRFLVHLGKGPGRSLQIGLSF